MRTSSISSTGYSYAKTNSHPNHAPAPIPTPPPTNSKVPSHYSHLRSRSGPPVTPQLPPLSAQVMQHQQCPPIATTRLDNNSESLVVVQRQANMPAYGAGKGYQRPGAVMGRHENGPNGFAVNDRPDSLAVAMDDLAKITQDLDDVCFAQGTYPICTVCVVIP